MTKGSSSSSGVVGGSGWGARISSIGIVPEGALRPMKKTRSRPESLPSSGSTRG
jgi:hypothetical protein